MENKICYKTNKPCEKHRLQCNTTCALAAEEMCDNINKSHKFPETKQTTNVSDTDKWISVKDRLPIATETGNWDGKKSEFVLIYANDITYIAVMYEGFLDGNSFTNFYDYSDFEIDNVTHWQPLPNAPK